MKKALSLVLVCGALLAFTSNRANASPDSKHEQSIDKETVALNDMAAPIVLQYTILNDAMYVPLVSQKSDVVATDHPANTIQPAQKVALNKDPLAANGRMWLYRHYFDPEDNKRYPEYGPDKLSEGFTTEVFHPVR